MDHLYTFLYRRVVCSCDVDDKGAVPLLMITFRSYYRDDQLSQWACLLLRTYDLYDKTRTHTHSPTHKYTHTHNYMFVHMCMCVLAHIYINIHIYLSMCVFVCMRVGGCMCVCKCFLKFTCI